MDGRADRWRVAGDRTTPPADRIAAIRDLAEAVEPDVASRARLWQDLLLPTLFDESEDDGVRIAAALAAGAVGGVAVNHLCRWTSPQKPHIRRAIVAALGAIGREPLSSYMEGRLQEDVARFENGLTMSPFINLTLTFGADQRIVPLLHQGTIDPQPDIRAMAVHQLAQIGDMAPATHALAAEPDGAARASAADAIGFYWTGEPEPISALRTAIKDDDPQVAQAARSALRRLGLSKIPQPRTELQPQEGAGAEIAPRYPWRALLRRWSWELCEDRDFALTQDDSIIESGWTGTGPVEEKDLRDLESRIGRPLPPSYRSFLKTTDGYVGAEDVPRVRAAREVRPFVEEESEWVDTWLEAPDDGESLTVAEHIASRGHDVVIARWSLLSDAIQVSDTYDGAVYLLCPTIVNESGEWEAWLLANWLPGAERFASWWDLMNSEYRTWKAR